MVSGTQAQKYNNKKRVTFILSDKCVYLLKKESFDYEIQNRFVSWFLTDK